MTRPEQTKVAKRSGKLIDTVAALRNVDFKAIIANHSTQLAHENFYSIIKTTEDYCQPLKMVKTGRDMQWVTTEIKQKIQRRQFLFFNGTVEEHDKLSKEVVRLIKRAKFKYNRNFTTGKPDYWKAIKNFKDQKQSTGITQEQAIEINSAFHNVWDGQ